MTMPNLILVYSFFLPMSPFPIFSFSPTFSFCVSPTFPCHRPSPPRTALVDNPPPDTPLPRKIRWKLLTFRSNYVRVFAKRNRVRQKEIKKKFSWYSWQPCNKDYEYGYLMQRWSMQMAVIWASF
jgi:hypothetical protein